MYYTYKVMIHPNHKQETKIRRTLNKCIECNNIIFDYLDGFMKTNKPIPSVYEVRRWFTIVKKEKDLEVINARINKTKKEQIKDHLDTLFYDVSNDALKQEIKDTYNAFVRFLKNVSSYPVRKTYKSYKKSFYVDPYKVLFTDKKVRLEKISNNQKKNRLVLNYISLAEKGRIPTNTKYYNPRVLLVGDRFYIVVGVDKEASPNKKERTKDTLGIDINVNSIYTSDNTEYVRITNTIKYKKTEKKLKKIQRRLSHKKLLLEEYNKTSNNKKRYRDAHNYQKLLKRKRKKQKRINNLIDSDIDNIITCIVNKDINTICIESLDVKEMKEHHTNEDKNKKYIAKGIQKNPFRKFIKRLEERCIKENIKIVKADKWYKSSKMCSCCKSVNDSLELSDRIYKCSKCGLVINRDYNASINLKNYALNNA